nr:MAG TPA: hypothetical protein [Caudoviricetes sp.]
MRLMRHLKITSTTFIPIVHDFHFQILLNNNSYL